MDSLHRNILSKSQDVISENVTLDKIKDLLIQYKIFNKYMWLDIKTMHDVFELLPTRGPEAFENFVNILNEAGYESEAENLKRSSIIDLFYGLPSKPVGRCLIINIFEFEKETKIEKRLGSDKDVESLTRFFKDIGYIVEPYENLKRCDMITCLENFARKSSMKTDVSIVFVMSHGSHSEKNHLDYVLGYDGEPVYKNWIIDLFNNLRSPHLQEKPKIFFFVACRGKKKDHGVPISKPSESTDSVIFNDIPRVTPTRTDMLVVHSTLPDHLSVRDDNFGSWFCQDLVYYLQQHYLKHDIENIMIMVSNSMKRRVSIDYGTQVVHRENFDFKKLYLCGKPSTTWT